MGEGLRDFAVAGAPVFRISKAGAFAFLPAAQEAHSPRKRYGVGFFAGAGVAGFGAGAGVEAAGAPPFTG